MATTDEWRQLRSYFPRPRQVLLWGTGLSILTALLLIPVPLVGQYILDDAIATENSRRILGAGAVLILLLASGELIGLLRRFVMARAGKTAVAELRRDLIGKLHDLPIAYHRQNDVGRIHDRIITATGAVDAMLQALVTSVLPAIVLSAGMAGVLLSLHWLAFLESLALMPVLYATYRYFHPRVQQAEDLHDASFEELSDSVILSLQAMELTRSHGAEEIDLARNTELISQNRQADERVRRTRGQYRTAERIVLSVFGVLVFVTLGIASARGDITVGEMVGFFVGLGLLVIPAAMTLAAVPVVREGNIALAEIMGFLNLPATRPYTGSVLPDEIGRISVRGVEFAYGDEALLTDVTLDISPGTVTMISGPNGSGKTSIIGLLMGLFRPVSGTMTMDGIPYDEVDMRAVRRRIGFAAQHPTILTGSIADNIRFGAPEASDADLWQAAHIGTVDDFIVDFPLGYDHMLGAEGRTLSGGQRHRIAIARALIRNPQLVILDEPTSHLDAGTLHRIITNLSRLPSNPAILITTHHPRVIDRIDHLYHIEGRRLIRDTADTQDDP